MTGAGVRIINASFGSTEIFEGPGDGTSPLADSFYSLVDAAVTPLVNKLFAAFGS